MKVTITDADLEHACMRLCFKRWSDIKAEARKMAAERMIDEGSKRVQALLVKIDAIVNGPAPHNRHAELMCMHAEIDRIWKDSDKLQRIAYPGAFKEPA